jgi:hypothetical protein
MCKLDRVQMVKREITCRSRGSGCKNKGFADFLYRRNTITISSRGPVTERSL